MKRDWLTLAFGVVLVGAVVALSLRENIARPPAQPISSPGARDSAKPTPSPAGAPPAASPAATVAVPAPERKAAAPRPMPSAAEAPASATAAMLEVHSDVPGASVFLDRQFVGTTPLTVHGLAAGRKQLNVTAPGHESYVAPVDVSGGPNRVNVEFLKVRLNATVPVVHRHGMGSCQGTLAASPKGLSYDTPHRSDAFTLALAEIDEFEVDYLKKNLKVRRRGGKTWNFTNNNADALFVFHRDVSKAKQRLSR